MISRDAEKTRPSSTASWRSRQKANRLPEMGNFFIVLIRTRVTFFSPGTRLRMTQELVTLTSSHRAPRFAYSIISG